MARLVLKGGIRRRGCMFRRMAMRIRVGELRNEWN
jgi:hypothetical protein